MRSLNFPDLSPFDYHVFSPRQDISTERRFTTDIQKQEAVIAQLVSRTKIFFMCIQKLISRGKSTLKIRVICGKTLLYRLAYYCIVFKQHIPDIL